MLLLVASSNVQAADAEDCVTSIGPIVLQDLDNMDSDGDGFSDCIEMELLGTVTERKDSDLDGIDDFEDLIPQDADSSVVGWAISVEVTLLKETGTKCDAKGSRYWDPYVNTGWLKLANSITGSNPTNLVKTGYTESQHKNDLREHKPETLVASITGLPQDIGNFYNTDGDGFPIGTFKLGLTDDDAVSDDSINIEGSGLAHWTSVPITQKPEGGQVTKTFTGSGDCRGKVNVKVLSPVAYSQVLAMTTDPAPGCDCVRYQDVRERMSSKQNVDIDEMPTIEYVGGVAIVNEYTGYADEYQTRIQYATQLQQSYHELGLCQLTGTLSSPVVSKDTVYTTRLTAFDTDGRELFEKTTLISVGAGNQTTNGAPVLEAPCASPEVSDVLVEVFTKNMRRPDVSYGFDLNEALQDAGPLDAREYHIDLSHGIQITHNW